MIPREFGLDNGGGIRLATSNQRWVVDRSASEEIPSRDSKAERQGEKRSPARTSSPLARVKVSGSPRDKGTGLGYRTEPEEALRILRRHRLM